MGTRKEELDTYPKVLIIGESFHLSSGGGITISHLFAGWPKSRIAVVTTAEKIKLSDSSICKLYYQLGYSENKKKYPFNLIQKKYDSGIEIINRRILSNIDKANGTSKERRLNTKIRRYFYSLLSNTGLLYLVDSYVISDKLLNFILEFSPDLIYTQLGSISFTKFINNLYLKTNIPYVVHIMDDWPGKLINEPKLLKVFYKNSFTTNLNAVFSNAVGHMAISNYMAQIYEKRYNKEFITFHNCVNFNFWNCDRDIGNSTNSIGEIRFLYAGRIGLGTSKSLLVISKALLLLITKGYKIVLEIQTSNIDHPVCKTLKKYKFIKFNERQSYKDLPKTFSRVDFLLLPIDFDNRSLRFIKYSMPTKVPEYMATGTPIILFAPRNTAVSLFFEKIGSAFIINKNDTFYVSQQIEKCLTNRKGLKVIADTAKTYCYNNFQDYIVRASFKEYLFQKSKINE